MDTSRDPLPGLLAGLTDDQVADLVASLPEPVITAMTRAGTPGAGSAPTVGAGMVAGAPVGGRGL